MFQVLLKQTCVLKYLLKPAHYKQLYSTACQANSDQNILNLFNELVAGSRGALSTAITLVESSKPSHKEQASHLLSLALQQEKDKYKQHGAKSLAFRIGLTGPPGAGKSTFIETMGQFLLEKGHRLAVLAIDPSSSTTGGSLMGDKTRMPHLTRSPQAYIRPSPSRGQLGGVTLCTNEVVTLCESAGYDIILVETVGVGQAEHLVADMTDMVVLLIPPGSGDELQGIKRGIVEVADLVAVTKCDGDLVNRARNVQSEYTSALKYFRSRTPLWKPKVVGISARENKGIPEMWETMQSFHKKMLEAGELEAKRREQLCKLLWNRVSDGLLEALRSHPDISPQTQALEQQVAGGEITPRHAASQLLQQFLSLITLRKS